MYSPFLNTCTHTHKQGHIRRNWKRRFFTLSRSSGTLTYYSKEEGGDRKGVFALQDSVVRLLPDHSKRLFLFEVVSATRVLRLSAQDEAERIAWCSALDPQFRVFQAMREYEQALQHLGEGVPLRHHDIADLLNARPQAVDVFSWADREGVCLFAVGRWWWGGKGGG
jgi:hypothetical protein